MELTGRWLKRLTSPRSLRRLRSSNWILGNQSVSVSEQNRGVGANNTGQFTGNIDGERTGIAFKRSLECCLPVLAKVTEGNVCVGCVYEKGGQNFKEFGPVILASGRIVLRERRTAIAISSFFGPSFGTLLSREAMRA